MEAVPPVNRGERRISTAVATSPKLEWVSSSSPLVASSAPPSLASSVVASMSCTGWMRSDVSPLPSYFLDGM